MPLYHWTWDSGYQWIRKQMGRTPEGRGGTPKKKRKVRGRGRTETFPAGTPPGKKDGEKILQEEEQEKRLQPVLKK